MFYTPLALIDFLDAREQATIVWAVVLAIALAVWILRRDDLSARALFGPLLDPLFRSRLTVIFTAAIVYLVGVMLLVQQVLPWHASSLKAALVWFGTGLIAVGRVLALRPERPSFTRILVEAVTVTVVVEFIVNLYAFSFVLELFLIPTVAMIALLRAFAASEERFAAVDRLLERVQIFIGLGLAAFVVWHVVDDPGSFFSRQNAFDFVVAPALTVLFLPLLYAVALLSAYEQLLMRIEFALADPTLQRSAKLAVLRAGRGRLARVDALVEAITGRWKEIASLDELRTVLAKGRSCPAASTVAEPVFPGIEPG